MTAAPALAATLDRARGRAGFGARLARASWTALAAAFAVELGVIAERGVPYAHEAGLVAGAVLALGALALLVVGRRPTRAEAARRLDAALAQGSLVETAAEALEGRHGAFAPLIVRDAESALAGSAVARLVPIEPPRAIGAGAGAALLLLALALGPVAERAPDAPVAPSLEIDLEVGGTPGEGPTRRGTRRVITPGLAGVKPTAKLDDATARALERDLRELAAKLGTRTEGTSSPDEEQRARELEDAIARSDVAAARAAIRALASAGTARSVKTVAKAADTIASRKGGDERSGGGGAGGSGSGTETRPGAGTGVAAGPTGEDAGKTAREEVPWRVSLAVDRYRAASLE